MYLFSWANFKRVSQLLDRSFITEVAIWIVYVTSKKGQRGFPITTIPTISQVGAICQKRGIQTRILSENRPRLVSFSLSLLFKSWIVWHGKFKFVIMRNVRTGSCSWFIEFRNDHSELFMSWYGMGMRDARAMWHKWIVSNLRTHTECNTILETLKALRANSDVTEKQKKVCASRLRVIIQRFLPPCDLLSRIVVHKACSWDSRPCWLATESSRNTSTTKYLLWEANTCSFHELTTFTVFFVTKTSFISSSLIVQNQNVYRSINAWFVNAIVEFWHWLLN